MPTTVVDPCDAVDGTYGVLSGAQFWPIEFWYAVELEREIQESVFVNSILPTLEVDFTRQLVPVFFPDQCPAVRRLPTERHQQQASSWSAVGISSSPPDTVDPEVAGCGDAEYCFGMHGQMTLYFAAARRHRNLQQQQQQEAAAILLLRNALKERMDAGTFDDAHPDIVRVTYVEPRPRSLDPPPITRGSSASSGVNPHWVAWPIVAAIALILAVVLFVWMRRRNRESAEEEEESDGDQDEESDVAVPPCEPEQARASKSSSYDLSSVAATSLASASPPAVEEAGVDDEREDWDSLIVEVSPPVASSYSWWDVAPSDEFFAIPFAAAALPRWAPSPSDEFYVAPVTSMPLARGTPPHPVIESDVSVPTIPPHHPYLVHHLHSHPPPTTDVDDDNVALHPSTAETGLLHILDQHENVDVEHLHEHIVEDDTVASMEATGPLRSMDRHRNPDVERRHDQSSGDDGNVSLRSSTVEAGLLRIVERHGNLDVEHLL